MNFSTYSIQIHKMKTTALYITIFIISIFVLSSCRKEAVNPRVKLANSTWVLINTITTYNNGKQVNEENNLSTGYFVWTFYNNNTMSKYSFPYSTAETATWKKTNDMLEITTNSIAISSNHHYRILSISADEMKLNALDDLRGTSSVNGISTEVIYILKRN